MQIKVKDSERAALAAWYGASVHEWIEELDSAAVDGLLADLEGAARTAASEHLKLAAAQALVSASERAQWDEACECFPHVVSLWGLRLVRGIMPLVSLRDLEAHDEGLVLVVARVHTGHEVETHNFVVVAGPLAEAKVHSYCACVLDGSVEEMAFIPTREVLVA